MFYLFTQQFFDTLSAKETFLVLSSLSYYTTLIYFISSQGENPAQTCHESVPRKNRFSPESFSLLLCNEKRFRRRLRIL